MVRRCEQEEDPAKEADQEQSKSEEENQETECSNHNCKGMEVSRRRGDPLRPGYKEVKENEDWEKTLDLATKRSLVTVERAVWVE